MSTYLTVWHYLLILLAILLFISAIYASIKEKNPKMAGGILFTGLSFSLLLGGFGIVVLDKYTKKAELFKVTNRRILSREQIVYQGYVRNSGDYTIKTVTFEIKLVNRGHATGNVKGGNFYKPSGFFDFIYSSSSTVQKSKPQTVVYQFVIAKNLKAGKSKHFRVTFPFPPYFNAVAEFQKVYAH